MQTFQEHFNTSQELRNQYWSSIGQLDPDVLSFLINPSLTGGPAWPATRQSFVLVRSNHSSIIASNGLSDPFQDRQPSDNNGFKIEFFLETSDQFPSIEDVKHSWQFDIVYQVSQIAARHGGVYSLMQDLKYLSVELDNIRVPDNWKNANNSTGVLLGLQHPARTQFVKLSAEEIYMVNIKLLTPAELAYCAACKDAERLAFGELLLSAPAPTLSSLERTSVI